MSRQRYIKLLLFPLIVCIWGIVGINASAFALPPSDTTTPHQAIAQGNSEAWRYRVDLVPLERWQDLLNVHGVGWVVSYGEWQKNWPQMIASWQRDWARWAELSANWLKLSLVGQVDDQRLRLTATLKLQLIESGWHRLPLPLTGVGIEAFRLKGMSGSIEQEAGKLFLWVKGPVDSGRLEIKLGAPINKTPRGQVLDFSVPTSPASSVAIRFPAGHDLQVLDSGLQVQKNPDHLLLWGGLNGKTRIHVRFRRTEGDMRQQPIAAAHIDTLYQMRPDLQWLDATVHLKIKMGQKSDFVLKLPREYRLIDLQAPNYVDFNFSEQSGELHLRLSRLPADGNVRLTLRCVRQGEIPAKMDLEPIRMTGAYSQTGNLRMELERSLNYRVISLQDARRMFEPNTSKSDAATLSFAYWRSSAQVKVEILAVKSRFSVRPVADVILSSRQARATFNLHIEVEEGSLYQLLLQIPKDWQLFAIYDQRNQELHYWSHGEHWQLDLPRRWSKGERQTLQVVLVRSIDLPQKDHQMAMSLPCLQIRNAEYRDGHLSVRWPQFYELTPKDLQNLQIISLDKGAATDAKVQQKFWKVEAMPYTGQISLQRKAARIETVAVARYQIEQDRIQGILEFHSQIQGSSISQFSVRLAHLQGQTPNFSVRGIQTAIKTERQVQKDGDEIWILHLPQERFGEMLVSAHLQWPHSPKQQQLELPVIRNAGHSMSRSFMSVAISGHTEALADPAGLEIADPLELPQTIDQRWRNIRPLFAYRYASGTQRLQLRLKPHTPQNLLDVVVSNFTLQANVTPKGNLRMMAYYSIWTNNGGYFEVTLPDGGELWSVLRNGQGIRPLRQKQVVRIALPHKPGKNRHQISLFYNLENVRLPKNTGQIKLHAPTISYHIQHSTWRLYLPHSHPPLSLQHALRPLDTNQPRALMPQALLWLKRNIGLFNFTFFILILLGLWWLRKWVWKICNAIWNFCFKWSWRWRKGLAITALALGLLMFLIIAFSFMLAMSPKKYSPVMQRDQISYRKQFVKTPAPGAAVSISSPEANKYWRTPPMQPPPPPSPSVVEEARPQAKEPPSISDRRLKLDISGESQKQMPTPDKAQQAQLPKELSKIDDGEVIQQDGAGQRVRPKPSIQLPPPSDAPRQEYDTIATGGRKPLGDTTVTDKSTISSHTTPSGVASKPAVDHEAMRDEDARMMQGIRSLSIHPQHIGWLVSSSGVGSVSDWRVFVFSETCLRTLLLSLFLLSFALWYVMGWRWPNRRMFLFWGGIILSGGFAMLLDGLSVILINAIHLGIWSAGPVYLWASLRQTIAEQSRPKPIHRSATKIGATIALIIGLGSVFAPHTAYSQHPTNQRLPLSASIDLNTQNNAPAVIPAVVPASVGSAVGHNHNLSDWRDLLCKNLSAMPSDSKQPLQLYAPYDPKRNQKPELTASQPVLIPSLWWQLMRLGGRSLCKPLPDSAAHWLQAAYHLRVCQQNQINGRAEFSIHILKPGQYRIALGLKDVRLLQATANDKPVNLEYANEHYGISLKGPGEYRVTLQFSFSAAPQSRHFRLQLAQAVAATAEVDIQGADWQIQIADAKGGSFIKRTDTETKLLAILGNQDALQVQWQPLQRKGDVEEETAALNARNLVSIQDHLLRIRSRFEFSRRFHKSTRFSFAVPDGVLLERMEGTQIRGWRLEQQTPQSRILTVILERPTTQYQIEITYALLRQTDSENIQLPLLQPLGIGRCNGWLGVHSSVAVEWSLRQTEHLEKRTISEWKEEMQTWGGQVDEVYVYRHPPSMRFAVRQKQDQRKISVKTLALIAHKHIRVESHISIANATLDNFTFSLLVSPALQIRQIQTKVGSPIRQTWFAGMQDQLRILRIELTQPMTQNQQIYLLAEQSIAQHKTDMPMIAPVHNRAWKGHLAIYTIGDLELETDNISHLKAIDLSPSQRISITREYRNYLPRLAYNFQRAYTGNVFLREVRSVRRCQLVLHSHLTRSRIHLRTTLNFHASGPGTQQFSFSLPDQLATHLEWIGYHSLNVKRSSETPGRTTFVFSSSHLLNNLQLAFRTHWPHTPEQTDVMPLIRPEDVQQSETLLALSASPDIRLMLDQIKLKELHTLPLDDFPIEDLDRRISTSSYIPAEEDSIIAAFRARQPKWQIILPQELLQTDIAIKPVVETAQLQTLLSYQGQAWTQAAYSVRTPGMQFLRVELPKQADLWQVTVDRQIIRPAKHENILLIPLPPRQISDLAYQVTLIYSHTLHLPKLFGSIQPLAPQLHNIDVSETFWQVFLPKEFAISDTDGNMEETVAIHIVYNRLKHELDFFHQLKGLSQTGKQSERTRATDNFKRQLRRMRRHLQQPSDYTKSPYRPPIAAPPAAPALMNRIQQRKSKEFEHKIQTLENTLRQLERSHESNQQPARPSRQQQFRQRRQYSPQQQGNYPQQQMHNYRQRRSYPQQQMRQNIDLNKGSFLFEPRQGLPLQDLSPRLAQPVPRTKKACSIKSSRSKNSSHALQPLTISMMGNQHTYVTIGGKPQLSLRIYRSDRFKIGIGWILWSIALLLAFYLWRRHTKYAA